MALTPSTMLSLGTAAPDFQLTDTVSGQTISLKNSEGKNIIEECGGNIDEIKTDLENFFSQSLESMVLDLEPQPGVGFQVRGAHCTAPRQNPLLDAAAGRSGHRVGTTGETKTQALDTGLGLLGPRIFVRYLRGPRVVNAEPPWSAWTFLFPERVCA